MDITDIHLKTAHLDDLKEFYADIVECPVTDTHTDGFTVGIGTTEIVFSKADDGSDPFYHFAINIPQNQFEDSVTWLSDRVELLSDTETGDDEIFFENWNAHAVYFSDPAGNLLELIARHDLSNDSDRPFGSENFLEVSEIGLPVPNVKRAVGAIGDAVGVSLRDDRGMTVPDGTSFAAVGDDYGLLIVVEEGREWFAARNQTAEIHPVTVEISDTTNEYAFSGLPYRITHS